MSAQRPELEDYLRLYQLYAGKLDFTIKGTKGGDYGLLFEQVMRMLLHPSPFNDELPSTFLGVAERYAFGDVATTEHFRYNENRQFFLTDLHDHLMECRVEDAERQG